MSNLATDLAAMKIPVYRHLGVRELLHTLYVPERTPKQDYFVYVEGAHVRCQVHLLRTGAFIAVAEDWPQDET